MVRICDIVFFLESFSPNRHSQTIISFFFEKSNKFLKIDKKNILPTNVYRLINKEGIVIQNIEPLSNTGKVKVGGELWSAISDTEIAKDTHIKITGVEGVKLKVEPVKQTSNK